MTELWVSLGMMTGVVGLSICIVQLMVWFEAKRADILRKHVTQAFYDGVQKGREESSGQ